MAGVGYFKSARYNQIVQLKYRSKYKKLKRCIKNYVFENSALCDEISQIQQSITIMKEERNYLLKKFLEHDSNPDVEKLRRHIQLKSQDPEVMPPDMEDVQQTPTRIPRKRGPKKRLIDGNGRKPSKSSLNKKESVRSATVIQSNSAETITFPVCFGGLTLHEIGEIPENNTNFHTEHWIYPVGFMSTRVYAHPKDPERKCTFTCKILNNDGSPQFQIIPDADYDHVFFGKSANICHFAMLETILGSMNMKDLPIRAQGELFFGLGQPLVRKWLQNNPNISKCTNFKGFTSDGGYGNNDDDPTLSFPALRKLITISSYHRVPEVKEEPPDDLLENK